MRFEFTYLAFLVKIGELFTYSDELNGLIKFKSSKFTLIFPKETYWPKASKSYSG
jgi:hypothetical protein